jgi:hypothetical protein
MWGGWGGLAGGLSGSLQDRRKAEGEDPALGNKGPDSGMTRGAQRRAYRIFLVVAAMVAALFLRACSLTVESGLEGHYTSTDQYASATPTPGVTR